MAGRERYRSRLIAGHDVEVGNIAILGDHLESSSGRFNA